jgi:hypothetical protein
MEVHPGTASAAAIITKFEVCISFPNLTPALAIAVGFVIDK